MTAIDRLQRVQAQVRADAWVALNQDGMDMKAPASALPISDAVQAALDVIRMNVLVGSGTYLKAMDYLDDDEKAQVRDPSGAGGVDLAAKIQPQLDAAYLLTGSDQTGAGGHGVCMDFDPGTWTFSTLQLKPGMALRGLVDRFEVRFKQTSTAQAPLIDVLGRGQNQDVIGRRTAVILERIDLNANGNYPSTTEAWDCVHLRVDPTNEGDDESANRTGLIMSEVQCGGASGWGIYNLKRGKVWLSKVQCAGNGKHPNLPNGKVGGLFSQGPDSFFHKTYCGNNGGIQMHIKSSATPSVVEVELGTSVQPDLYPTVCIERCTDVMFGGGGNCTGWIQVIGAENDNTQNEYDTECRINFYDFVITLKDKSFQKQDGTFFTMNGAFSLENVRGVHISNVRVKAATDDDIAAHHYTHRPTNVVYIKGSRTRATWHGPLPPLDDWNWPAGAPETWPGSPPTNARSSMTNKQKQLRVLSYDPTDTTGSILVDRIAGFYGALEIASGVTQVAPGQWDITGGTILRPTGMSTAVDITVGRNDVTVTGDVTLTFSGTPVNGTMTTLTVKATGANRTITLPAGVVDMLTGASVTSFVLKTNKSCAIGLMYMFGEWKIWGYPIRELLDKDYADDVAAAAGGVAIGEMYHTTGTVKVRRT